MLRSPMAMLPSLAHTLLAHTLVAQTGPAGGALGSGTWLDGFVTVPFEWVALAVGAVVTAAVVYLVRRQARRGK